MSGGIYEYKFSDTSMFISGSFTNELPISDQVMQKNTSSRIGGDLTAFIFSLSSWSEMRNGGVSDETTLGDTDPIVMLINPESIRWNIPQRISRSDVFGGSVFHKWKNIGDSSVDFPKVTFTINTGLIYPLSWFSNQQLNKQYISYQSKIKVFYRFLQMAHAPAYTPNGNPNYIEIITSSLLFPQVNLLLVLDGPIDWEENSREPFNIKFTLSGVVIKSNPNLYDWIGLMGNFSEGIL